MSSVSSMRGRMAGASVYSSQGCFPASVAFMSMLACSTTSRPARATPACPTVIIYTYLWLVEEDPKLLQWAADPPRASLLHARSGDPS